MVVRVRANITTQPGTDLAAVGAALKSAFENRVAGLGLGGPVLASEALRDLLNVAGVVDVQNLHLRRYPPAFGSIVFGDREQFQGAPIEADIGANLSLTSDESGDVPIRIRNSSTCRLATDDRACDACQPIDAALSAGCRVRRHTARRRCGRCDAFPPLRLRRIPRTLGPRPDGALLRYRTAPGCGGRRSDIDDRLYLRRRPGRDVDGTARDTRRDGFYRSRCRPARMQRCGSTR